MGLPLFVASGEGSIRVIRVELKAQGVTGTLT